MVEDIAQFFDEALQVHLLYRQEQAQCFIIQSDPNDEKKKFCEIYGCEYLLRLFVRFPSFLLQSNIEESQANKIFFKIGDFVRFLQKHQSRFFLQSYRKYLDKEVVVAKKMEEDDKEFKIRPNLKGTTKTEEKKGFKNDVSTTTSGNISDDLDEPISSLVAKKAKMSSGGKKKRGLSKQAISSPKKKQKRKTKSS